MIQKIESKHFAVILGVIVAFSFILRIWGNDFGLPYEYHVDEVQYVRQAASMGESGFEPSIWNNPPFFKYILFLEYGALYVFGRILGIYSSTVDYGNLYFSNPTTLYLLARGTSAIFGSITVLLIGIIGRVTFNDRVGLISAWFLAICFIHVRDSHFAVNDMSATFFILVVLFSSLKILLHGERKWYILAGISLGFGFATKYTVFLSVTPIIIAHFLSTQVDFRRFSRLRLTELLLCSIITFCSSVLASPFFLITPGKVFNSIYDSLYLPGQLGFDGWQIDPAGGYIFYLKSLLWGLGYGLLFLSLLGLIVSVVYRSRESIVILSFPVLLYFFMGRQEMYFSRFLLPAIPPLLLWSAKVFDDFFDKGRLVGKQYYIFTILLMLFTLPPLLNSIRLDFLLKKADTRTLAKIWIENNVPAGSKIGFDWSEYSPPLSSLEKQYSDNDNIYDVVILGRSGLSKMPIGWYSDEGFDYIVVSSFISDISLSDEQKDSQRKLFYKLLNEKFELVNVVSPSPNGQPIDFVFDEIYSPIISLWQRERPGPILMIYKIP